jgi:Tfp pilus assembly protein FimT
MMMVLIIIGIVAAVVIPNAISTSSFQATSAARMIATDLQYAQDTAITSQTPITVTFNVGNESYRLSNASGTLIHPITKSVYVTDFGGLDGFSEVDIVSADFNGAAAVTFDELGAPDRAGTVVMRAGDHAYRLDVAPATGKVTVTRSGS